MAESMRHGETLDLFRHASELQPHPLACLGFAAHVVAATTPEAPTQAAALMLSQPWVSSFGCHVPPGYDSEYTQQALVAVAGYSASPEGEGDARAHHLAGVLLERLEMAEAAVLRYRRAVQLLPPTAAAEHKAAAFGLGRALVASGQAEEAVHTLAAAGPATMSEFVVLARALVAAGQLRPAFEVCYRYEGVGTAGGGI